MKYDKDLLMPAAWAVMALLVLVLVVVLSPEKAEPSLNIQPQSDSQQR
jgi:hypothetical protein